MKNYNLVIVIADCVPKVIDKSLFNKIYEHPAAHQHPLVQVEFLEKVVRVCSSDNRVLIVTYSPYILAHINTLTVEKKYRKKQFLFLQDKRSFIDASKVDVYEYKGETLISQRDADYGFRWESVSNISAEIQSRFFAMHR